MGAGTFTSGDKVPIINIGAGLLLAKTPRCFAAAEVKPMIRHRMPMPLSTRSGRVPPDLSAEPTRRVHVRAGGTLPNRVPTVIATDLRWMVGAQPALASSKKSGTPKWQERNASKCCARRT